MDMETTDIPVTSVKAADPVTTTQTHICGDLKRQFPNQDDPHLIQIRASSSEIARRISALIEQKQREVDMANCQEFCGVHPALEASNDTCARTSAEFVPRAGGKSHIKVSRVVNMYGPQTHFSNQANQRPYNKQAVKQADSTVDGLEERLSNMEEHLQLAGPKKSDIYSRLKELEERILFLESLSPEYFSSGPPRPKKLKPEPRDRQVLSRDNNDDLSIEDIDKRINELRETLHHKIQT